MGGRLPGLRDTVPAPAKGRFLSARLFRVPGNCWLYAQHYKIDHIAFTASTTTLIEVICDGRAPGAQPWLVEPMGGKLHTDVGESRGCVARCREAKEEMGLTFPHKTCIQDCKRAW